ncbi:protein CCSMST1 [Orycteropus afer afer]|uniref:Protein CCSMST1 n=1 Tax=Orycteropus afer afer TaxID=1230840 RepID=A0A8B6ZQ73_ORYAF|nr:protein CCSMST1 [Orycteropus afer afer]
MSRVLCAPAAGAARSLRLVRWGSQSLHSQSSGRARAQPVAEGEEEDLSRPIQFSSSRAYPSHWLVAHSLGSVQQRPWWKVLPLSLTVLALIVWCFLRRESRTDECLKDMLEEEAEPSDHSEEPGAGSGART